MSDIDFLMLHTKFAGFRIMVLANRLGCTNDLARKAHDRLALELETLVALMREGLAAERRVILNTDPALADDLGETLWCYKRNFEDMCDPEGHDLLENRIWVDWGSREWFNPHNNLWISFYDMQPPIFTIAGERLCGLDRIIARIAAETGVRFKTEVSGSDDGDPDPADIDPECYEDLHGFGDEEDTLSAIYVLANGIDRDAEA